MSGGVEKPQGQKNFEKSLKNPLTKPLKGGIIKEYRKGATHKRKLIDGSKKVWKTPWQMTPDVVQ